MKVVLLRFAKKSPTSSPGTDIDVGRPNIDVLNILEIQVHNSGTVQRTEMADHSLESLEPKSERTAAQIFLWQRIMTENGFIHLKVVSKVQLCTFNQVDWWECILIFSQANFDISR